MTNQAIGLNNYATGENSRYPELWRGCVGAWAMCLGPTGTRLHDFSGRQNWGTLTNMDAATDWVVSGGQYALDFDGVDDYTTITSHNAFDISNIKTISAWINPVAFDGASSATDIIAKDAAIRDWSLTAYDTGLGQSTATISFSVFGSSGGYLWRRTDSEVLVTNKWQHVAFTYDGAISTINMRLFLDGNLQATSDLSSGAYGSHPSNSNPLLIGLRGGLNSHWNGQLDDIRIYSRALTEPEIKLLASRRGIGLQPSPTKFIAREKKTGLRRKILTGQT